MSDREWWQARFEPKRSRLFWFERVKSAPGIPVQIVPASIADPIPCVLSIPIPGSPSAVSIDQTDLVRIQPVVNVNLRKLVEPGTSQSDQELLSGEFAEEKSSLVLSSERAGRSPSISRRLRSALALPIDLLLPGEGSVLEWPSALMPYQELGVRALIKRPRVLLADDMGLGKTIQAVAAIRILCQQGVIHRTLLIVPASLIDQWRREFAKWTPELRVIPIRGTAEDRAWLWSARAHVMLVSYETFRSDSPGDSPSPARRNLWDLVVLDEAQRIKNRESETSRQVKRVRRLRSWAMTGTPLENRVDDLASILEFVDHQDDGTSRTYVPGRALVSRLQELQLRRRKTDVLTDLPLKQVITIPLTLPAEQRAAYDRAEKEGLFQLREHGSSIRIEHILELITRLKQLSNRDPVSGESAKLDDIRGRIRILNDEGHRALLFSQYTDSDFGVAAAATFLKEFNPLVFTGALSNDERSAVIDRFKRDKEHQAMILSLRAGGVGLNLQDASYVFHMDRWWNPAVERQAEDRTHRIGQQFPVTVIKYTCLNTIEERIEQILAEKQLLFDEFVDDVSFDLANRLTRDDLLRIVKLDQS